MKKREFCSDYCKSHFELLHGPCTVCKRKESNKWLKHPLKKNKTVCTTCYHRIKSNAGRKGKCTKCKKTKSYQFNYVEGKQYCKKCYNEIYNTLNQKVKLRASQKYNLKYYDRTAHYFPNLTSSQMSWLDKSWSSNIKLQDDMRCKICKGFPNFSHHIIEKEKYKLFRFFSNNGITLCQICHHHVHVINMRIQLNWNEIEKQINLIQRIFPSFHYLYLP